jgi:phage anti-repressor protein
MDGRRNVAVMFAQCRSSLAWSAGWTLASPGPRVNARDLDTFLEIGRVFGVGIAERIEGIGFVKDQYCATREGLSVPNSESSKSRAQKTKEYLLSTDIAKELSTGVVLIASGDRRAVWVCRGIRLQGRHGAHRDLSRSASAARGTHPARHQLSSGARVNARDLHTFLEIGKHFGSWITDRISDLGFVENQNFGVNSKSGKNPQGGRPSKECLLSMDMAKELSMMERNEKGKQVRRYFIECEKRLRNMPTVPALGFSDPLTAAKLYIEAEEGLRTADAEVKEVTEEVRPGECHPSPV